MIALRTWLACAVATALASCRPGASGRDCAGLTREQCAWRRAVNRPTPGTDPETPSSPGFERGEQDGPWTRADAILRQLAAWLADGLEGASVSRQAREWCAELPTLVDKGHGPSWVCHLHKPPRLAGRDLTLEGSDGGVLALGARDLSGDDSRRLIAQALERWRLWCIEARFSPLERAADQEFHSCALPGGPLLVVGRFPQDLDDDLWQVSLTIMGTG